MRLLRLGMMGLSAALTFSALAGGSGLNTVVIVNQNSTNSCELGNYYCERRQVPPDNLLRISWPGGNTSWTRSDFETNLLQPLLTMLAERQLTNQIDYVVLSMDIPFQTLNGSTVNSTTAALFYGLKPDGSGMNGYRNSYSASEAVFRLARPASAPGYSFLTTMLTADSLAQAERVVDQGISSDGRFPSQPAMLEKTSDPSRNIRYPAFDNAIFNVRLLGKSLLFRTNSDSPPSPAPALGYQTGLANFTLATNTFVPGAIADSLSSFGGIIFGATGQTSLLAFLAAGAAGSYGTVAEPLSDPQKFPDPQDYFYQARGFTLAECYYQSLNDPFLGLIVGEPLAAPFAQAAAGKWLNAVSNTVLSAIAQLSVSFSSRGGFAPLQQIDLLIDGRFYQTLTNLGPSQGNLLKVALNGYPISYNIPADATLASATTGLVAVINTPAITNLTKVKALAFGDRIELRSLSTNYHADPFYFLDTTATNGGNFYYRVSYLPFPTVPQLAPAGFDSAGGFRLDVETAPRVPFLVLASTNLVDWLPIGTNLIGGEQDFVDSTASHYPRRFYRLAAPDQRPRLSLARNGSDASFTIRVQSLTSVPYLLQASTNLTHWTTLSTNSNGGNMDFVDPPAPNAQARFYRVSLLPPILPAAAVTMLPPPPSGGNLLSIAGAARSYTVEVSTNQLEWSPLMTNFALAGGQVAVNTSIGTAGTLSTFLSASRPAFLDSITAGTRSFYLDGTVQIGSWLQLEVTTTNGVTCSVAVTNQSSSDTLATLSQQLLTAINSAPEMQASDGLVAEDFGTDPFGSPSFHLRTISPGYDAAGLQVLLSGSSDVSIAPWTRVALNQNLVDLQPRNHLYLTAGLPKLAVTFPLDTTSLADGFHELTAVASEGSHVRTQTRVNLAVRIQNSSLTATLSLLDLSPTNIVQGTYHIRVAANTNSVTAISLFSTGGLLATATNQSAVTFSFNGPALGAGFHHFYALVQTSDGLQYRTETRSARLVNAP